ncbi:MAG: hypothetical protein GYA48_17250 [Chloroflexi bacterium]|nr:hypothetical protein [Chloroflexota bacterium]
MLKHSGHHLGDSWYFVDGQTIHCFYLTCPENIERHTSWDIGHAVSNDLINWQIEEIVLRKGEPESYDGRCPATGSVIRAAGRYWMAYTGNWNGPQPTVAMAVSDDLYHWEKLSHNPVTTIDARYYDPDPAPSPRDWRHWRDPFLFAYDGYIYHAVCTKLNRGPADQRGTLGLARTTNMLDWEVLPPPDVEPIAAELECPQIHSVNGLYYLVFSTARSLFAKDFRERHFDANERWSSYSMVGPSPFGPFKMFGNGEIIPCDYPLQPYANQVVFWKGQGYLMGTVWNEIQDYLTDPIPLDFSDDGVKVRA